IVRDTHIQAGLTNAAAFRLSYCTADAQVTFRTKIDDKPLVLPRTSWEFLLDGCALRLHGNLAAGLYEVIYHAKGSPVAGLGLAAIRDFAAYLKQAPESSPLHQTST